MRGTSIARSRGELGRHTSQNGFRSRWAGLRRPYARRGGSIPQREGPRAKRNLRHGSLSLPSPDAPGISGSLPSYSAIQARTITLVNRPLRGRYGRILSPTHDDRGHARRSDVTKSAAGSTANRPRALSAGVGRRKAARARPGLQAHLQASAGGKGQAVEGRPPGRQSRL